MAREQDALNRQAAGTTAASYPPGTSSEQIRQDIARTRSEMDQTVDALGERLKPRHVLDEMLDYFGTKGDTASGAGQALRDGASGLIERVKEHPMPALLIGAGVAWMLFEGDARSRTRLAKWDRGGRRGDIGNWRDLPEHGGSVVDARTGEPYDEASYAAGYRAAGGSASGGSASGGPMPAGGGTSLGGGGGGPGLTERAGQALSSAGEAIGGAASSAGGAIAGAAQSVKQAIAGAAGSAREATSGIAGSAAEYAQGARGAASEYGGRAYDAAGRAYGRTGQYAGRGYDMARGGVSTAMDEYPLSSGVAALALGAIAGLLLPATRRENELMGEYADELKGQAKHLGEEIYDRGKTVATTAASAATGAAGEAGADPGSLKEKVRHVVEDVTQAAAQGASRILEDVKQTAADAGAAATQSAKREGLEPSKLKETAQEVATRVKDAATEEAQRQREKPL